MFLDWTMNLYHYPVIKPDSVYYNEATFCAKIVYVPFNPTAYQRVKSITWLPPLSKP
jgi:hypothetical protein